MCKSTFSTREQPVHTQSILVRTSQNKKLQPFSRDTLFLSIYEACKHRPHAIKDTAALTETVMAAALKMLQDSVIERDALATTTYTALNHFDDTAARVYAAYHPL